MFLWLLLISLFFIFFYDILQLFIDLFFYPKNCNDTINRIQPLWKKYNNNKYIGPYEKYVLNRELTKYVKTGGDLEYFYNGFGSM